MKQARTSADNRSRRQNGPRDKQQDGAKRRSYNDVRESAGPREQRPDGAQSRPGRERREEARVQDRVKSSPYGGARKDSKDRRPRQDREQWSPKGPRREQSREDASPRPYTRSPRNPEQRSDDTRPRPYAGRRENVEDRQRTPDRGGWRPQRPGREKQASNTTQARPYADRRENAKREQRQQRTEARPYRDFRKDAKGFEGRPARARSKSLPRVKTPERVRAEEAPHGEEQARPLSTDGTIVVNRRAAARLRGGNPWGYRSDMVSDGGAAGGNLAPVTDERGKLIGTALYSSSSQIALRMISGGQIESEQQLLALIRERFKAALEYRNRVVEGSDGYRVVFSEADQLPGLIVDRYNDVLSMQVLTQAMDRHGVRDALVQMLVEHFQPSGIVERVDARIRELEELPPRETELIWGEKSATTFSMNGLQFQFDGLAGQKTGAFLDQRENYVAATKYARGEALDVFCYQGGFALHMARPCERVTGVDSSRPALEVAEQNLALNADELRAHGVEVDWIEANAFDLLRDYADTGKQYDTIVLDPPAFAKSKRALDTAIRGYKELNLRGLKMVRKGGVFVTCSCSHHVSESDFLNMLADAAADAHRTVRIIEKRTQAKDHPVLLSMPETQYLKCVIAMID